ncbi:hypothetical protein MBANPS3_010278 [Mucor bainieri]
MIWTSSTGSVVAGYISIVFWLVVFIPQLLENYRRKNGDGLSLTFLLIWLAGDLFNLAGIIMEKLMFTMFLLALWYTVADIGLIWQVVYYQQCVTAEIKCDQDEAIVLLNRKSSLTQRRVSLERSNMLSKVDTVTLERQSSAHDALLDDDANAAAAASNADMIHDDDGTSTHHDTSNSNSDRDIYTIQPKIKPIWVNLIGSSVMIVLIAASCYGYMMTATTTETMDDDATMQLVPQILGWLSAVLYIGSRVPQLIKNWRQQSTDGLSSGMFVCAVFGNFFFALSIFLRSTERRYIIKNMPWIIGSLATVIFDIMIFLQFYVFNRRKLKHRAD